VGRPGSLTSGRDGPNVTLRAAREDDVFLIREWRNDADAVRVSATARPVSKAEHERWFSAVLADRNRRLWVAEESGRPVGQVRVDLDGSGGILSIVVAPTDRGRGIGQAMLRGAVGEVDRDGLATMLTALAREDNMASIHAFEHIGFRRRGEPEGGYVTLQLVLG
jgi:UDP-2,4-diacetamido-2,4,6-trideoxy-beta-L-altropyranose hydrolase